MVVCDIDGDVLETYVVPDDGSTMNLEFTPPKRHKQIRVFAIGSRLDQENAELFAKNYFVGEAGMEADIEDGVFLGCSAVSKVSPLNLDAKLREKVAQSIKASRDGSVIKVNSTN